MEKLQIRKATGEDIKKVAALYGEMHSAEEEGKISTGWIRGVYPTEDTAKVAYSLGELYAGFLEGRLVASAIINKTQPDSYLQGKWRYEAPPHRVLVLHTLCVSPSLSSKGIGRDFISFYENMARELGCSTLRIDTNEKNQRARGIYKRLGYLEAGIVPCVFNGIPGVNLVLLEKRA